MKENSPARMLEQFLELSEILTGCKLDGELGRAHFDRLLSAPLVPSISEVLKRFEKLPKRSLAEVERKMLADAKLRPTLCQIVLLWYTSALRDSEADPLVLRYGNEQAYFGGLVWRILGAHAPGLSGGYFGHWRYRPDNEPEGTLK
jgi:Membrane bound FAD containing D-sorbitol dehydrogenase